MTTTTRDEVMQTTTFRALEGGELLGRWEVRRDGSATVTRPGQPTIEFPFDGTQTTRRMS